MLLIVLLLCTTVTRTVVHVYMLGHHVRDATIQELLCHVVEFYVMIHHLSQPRFHAGFHIRNSLEI